MQDDFERLLKDVNLSSVDDLPDAPTVRMPFLRTSEIKGLFRESYDTQEMLLSDVQLGNDAQRYLRFVRACYDVNYFPSPEQALSIQSHMQVSQAERDLINDLVFDEIAERYGVPIEQRMRADYNAASVNRESYLRYVRTRQRIREQQQARRRRLQQGPFVVRLWRRFVSSNVIADEEE